MSQANIAIDGEEQDTDDEAARELMRTTHGHERRELDVADDEHALADMDSERQAPIEAVAKNVVRRYDQEKAFIREYLANAHTACIQRAKLILIQNEATDGVNMDSVRDVLEAAEEQFGYEPVITVMYNMNPDARWTFKIKDNGIGIDSQTAYALRDIGLSGWHMDGFANGMFGQGTMSGFLPTDTYGEFTVTTKSMATGENYRAALKLTDVNKLNGKRDSIGTTFTWPTFTDDAESNIDVYEAVREYAEGLVIPVRYEEYGEDGRETGRSDEFLPEFMEERYPDDALVISFSDIFGKAVWSPDDPEGWNSNINTFCGYQPIKRNERGFSLNSYEMPSAFDFRLKVEDGSIIEVDGSMDHELVGKTPVQRQKYRSMLLSERNVVPESFVDDDERGYVTDDGELLTTDEEQAEQLSEVSFIPERLADNHEEAVVSGKYAGRPIVSDDEWESMDDGRIGEEFVPRDEIPDDLDILQAMSPTDDRDRFERRHVEDVLRRYSEKLWDELRKQTAQVFEEVDEFNDIFELEGNRQALFHKGVDRFGPDFKRSSASTIQETIEDELDVTLPESVCEKLGVMKKTVSLAPRGESRPQHKGNRRKKPVWKVIRLAKDNDRDGNVYMGFRINKRKAKLAWELNEHNQVVQTTKRELFEKKLGWKDMRDLPTKNFEKHFDVDFAEDFLDSWDKARTDGSGSNTGDTLSDDVKTLSYNDKRAQKRDVTVRRGTGRGKMYSVNGEKLFETLQPNGSCNVSFKRRYDIEKLLLYRETEHNKGVGETYVNESTGVYYAVVPNYVYDYLIEADEAYTEQEYLDSLTDEWIDFDWSDSARGGRTLATATKRDVILMGTEDDVSQFKEYGVMDEFRDRIEDALNPFRLDDDESIRSVTFMEDLDQYEEVLSSNGCYEFGPNEERPSIVSLTTGSGYGFPSDASIARRSAFLNSVLDELDFDAPEWNAFSVDIGDDDMIETMLRLQDVGGFVSTDDDPDVPTLLGPKSTHEGSVRISEDELYITKTLERLEDAGGFVGGDD